MKLTVGVSEIQLDPEDELTQNVEPKNVVYYIYQNRSIVGIVAPSRAGSQEITTKLTAAMINEPSG